MPVDMKEHATYHTDRVTVRMLARMPDRIDDICASLNHETPFMAVIGADKVPGEPMVELMQFHAWARKRVICDMRIVGGHRFADAAYKAPSAMPETIRTAAAGRPCRDVIDHPALDDVRWDVEQDGGDDMLSADLNSDIDLGYQPGTRLRELALAERRRLAAESS